MPCKECRGRGTLGAERDPTGRLVPRVCYRCGGTGVDPDEVREAERREIAEREFTARTREAELARTSPESPPLRLGRLARSPLGRFGGGVLAKGTRLVCRNPRCGWTGTKAELKNGRYCPRCFESGIHTTQFSTQRSGVGDLLLFALYFFPLIGFFLFIPPVRTTIDLMHSVILQLTDPIGLGGLAFASTWFVIIIICLLSAYKLAKMPLRWGLFDFSIMTILILVFSLWAVPTILLSEGVSGPMTTFGCIVQNLANPSGLTACLQTGKPGEAPAVQKVGSYNVLNVKLGSEFTSPAYQLQPMMSAVKDKDKTRYLLQYVFPVTVENPNDDLTIENFMITDGIIINETVLDPNEPIAFLALDACNGSKGCKIKPLEKKLLTVKSTCNLDNKKCAGNPPKEDDVPYKGIKRPVTIKLTTKYDFENDGKNGMIFVKSANELRSVPLTRPETGKGPIDITVYFSPDKYLFDSGLKTVYVFVNLANKERGYATIKEIELTRSSEDFIKIKNCRLGANEFTKKFVGSQLLDSKKQISAVCEYDVTAGSITEPYKTITFIVKMKYTYSEDISQTIPITDLSPKP